MFGVVLALSAAFTPADSTRSDSLQVIEIQASSALGFGQKASDLGSGVRVEARVLRQLQSVNPNELAATVPGLIARDEDGFGLRFNWGIRGTGTERSSRIVLMEDGVLTAPAAYSSPAAYYQPSLMRMAGMDVAKGSSQIAAGPQTTGGAINFASNAPQVPHRLGFVRNRLCPQLGFGGRNQKISLPGMAASAFKWVPPIGRRRPNRF